MKKITLTLLGLVAFSTSALAQQEVRFGPKAGVNIANISGKDANDNKMLIGFHVGAFAEIKFNDKFAIQPEILYSSQGYKSEALRGSVHGGLWITDSNAKIDYINIPIMAKYYIVSKVAIEVGPYVGFLVSAEEKTTVVSKGSSPIVGNLKEQTSTVDFGIGAGASFNLDNGFFIGARYNLGLSDIRKNNDSGEAIKNAVIQVSVGYKF